MDTRPSRIRDWAENHSRPAVFGASAIGLMAGLVMGLPVSPTVGMAIGSLASLSALTLGLQDRFVTQTVALLIGVFGLVGVAGVLLGTYIRAS